MNKILSYTAIISFMVLGVCLGHALGTNSADKRWLKYQEENLDKAEKDLQEREKKLDEKEKK